MKNWQVCEIVDYRIEFGIAQLAGEILDTTDGLLYRNPLGELFPAIYSGKGVYELTDQNGNVSQIREIDSDENRPFVLEPETIIGEKITKNRVMVKQLDRRGGAWLDFGYDDPWHPDEYYFVADNFNADGDHIETDFLLKACLISTKRVGTQFGIPVLTIDA
jgi:hypothetical protein